MDRLWTVHSAGRAASYQFCKSCWCLYIILIYLKFLLWFEFNCDAAVCKSYKKHLSPSVKHKHTLQSDSGNSLDYHWRLINWDLTVLISRSHLDMFWRDSSCWNLQRWETPKSQASKHTQKHVSNKIIIPPPQAFGGVQILKLWPIKTRYAGFFN